MCCSPVCAQLHSRVAMDRRRCKWSDRGLSAADTIGSTNHLLLSSKTKKMTTTRSKWEDKLQDAHMRLCVLGRALITVWTQDVAITVHSMAVLKKWLVRLPTSSLFCNFYACVKDNSCSPARINYKECWKEMYLALCLCFGFLFVFFAEVGKNINQDLSLRLKRFVEDYHKYAQSLNIPKPQPKTAHHQHEGQRAKHREGNF